MAIYYKGSDMGIKSGTNCGTCTASLFVHPSQPCVSPLTLLESLSSFSLLSFSGFLAVYHVRESISYQRYYKI